MANKRTLQRNFVCMFFILATEFPWHPTKTKDCIEKTFIDIIFHIEQKPTKNRANYQDLPDFSL